MNIAHKFGDKVRTGDVLISEEVDFSSLLLSDQVIQGLQNCGFERPSPIQLKAIPLGRCGLDLIVQAKSGTGKTCVFAVVSLESIQVQSSAIQVLVLAPTREIAIQIWEVMRSIGGAMPALRCHTFIGGMPLSEDKQKLKKCQIAVGSPGRIKQLIEMGLMKTDSIRLFVLDEADKLLEDSFQEQINWIYSALPDNKQMLALSATYPESLAHHLTRYMRNPTFMRLNISDPALLGIRQFYKSVPYSPMPNLAFEAKAKAVIDLLSGISFQQCLVFSNLQTRAQNLSDDLQSRGWPTACIAGSHEQKDRIEAMSKLKTYKCRVLISTDLTSRGIDADKVNLVINLDVPQDHETYLHRIGRAGRFGSFGAAVTIVSSGQEELELRAVERKCNTNIKTLPDPLPMDLLKTSVPVKLDDVVSTEQLITRPTESGDQQAANQNKADKESHEEQNGLSENSKTSNGNVQTATKGEQVGKENDKNMHESKEMSQLVMDQVPLSITSEITPLIDSSKTEKSPNEENVNKKDKFQIRGPDLINSMNVNLETESISGKESSKEETEFVKEEKSTNHETKCNAHSVDTGNAVPGEHQNQEQVHHSKVNPTENRRIAKAQRKRKLTVEADVNVNCNPVKDPSPVEIRSTRHAEAESVQSVFISLNRGRHPKTDKPHLTVPCLRERLGCERLVKPHSYTSALVDYERFLEENETVENVPEVDLIKCKIDDECKAVCEDGVFAQQMKECIDRIYSFALSEGVKRTSADVEQESNATAQETPMMTASVPCVQKCSKSTQTSGPGPRFNNRPKSVRYHPMSVSSLALVGLGSVADEDINKDTESETLSTDITEDVPQDSLTFYDLEAKAVSSLAVKEEILQEATSNSDSFVCFGSKHLSGNVQGDLKHDEDKDSVGESALIENCMEETLNDELLRNNCELVYVSDSVGKISLTAAAVTVEPELLKSITSRPKSRKGKITADLDGYEYGRICHRQAAKEDVECCDVNGVDEKLVLTSEEIDTSDSDSSSSSSDYEREVFCNNYVDDLAMPNQRQQYTKTKSAKQGDGRNKSQRDYYRADSYENTYFQDNYQSNEYNYEQNSHEDYYPYEQYYGYNPGEADAANQMPWPMRHAAPGYYPPYNYFPPYQYYPHPYYPNWYPPQGYPYPQYPTQGYFPTAQNTWRKTDSGWGRTDGERIDTMKRNTEFQRKYIKKMAKRK